jgi:hypothetical protein
VSPLVGPVVPACHPMYERGAPESTLRVAHRFASFSRVLADQAWRIYVGQRLAPSPEKTRLNCVRFATPSLR